MPLLHFMDSCSYVRKKYIASRQGGCICTLNPPLLHWYMLN